MKGLGFSELLEFYKKVVTQELISELKKSCGVITREGVYTHAVVIWLMIYQRISGDGTLLRAVEELRNGIAREFLESISSSKKVKRGKISSASGAYSKGRTRLPDELVYEVSDRINSAITTLHTEERINGYKVFVIDGSSVRLEHSEANLNQYPQCSTEKTKAHYPLARIVVATDAVTRVTMRPESGAFHGSKAKGELELGMSILPGIPEQSVIMADRLYGCFRFIYEAISTKKQVLIRLSEKRAHKFLFKYPKSDSGDIQATWHISKAEQKKYSEIQSHASVSGRCVWITVRQPGFRPNKIILFTTLDLPVKDLMEIYALRWNVEDTLRDIKTTVKMDFIHAKSPSMVHKELALGVVGYNLVRHFMATFAKAHKLKIERMSFTNFLRRIQVTASTILTSSATIDIEKRLKVAFLDPSGFTLPKRKNKQLAEPRKKWPKGDKRTFMQGSREQERKKLAEPPFRTTYIFN